MQTNYDVNMQLDVKVPMRDGINLSADIYLPRARGKFPTVLMRTPYDNNADNMVEKARRLANNGYACIIQDCRGRWDSEGEYYAFREGEDGYDTQKWIGKQDWCNGKIGMAGSSYGGTVQWRSAPYRSQYLKCITPPRYMHRLLLRSGPPRRRISTQRHDDLGHAYQRPHRSDH